MNRLAIALILNQGLIEVLSAILALVENLFSNNTHWSVDMGLRLAECVVYFVSFVLPVHVFNSLNKNAPREIYEPYETKKATALETATIIGMSLGIIMLAAYANYFAVNIFWDYSDFTSEYFWAVDIDHTYQAIIYFIYCAIIPAVVEELLFRGTVCRVLKVYSDGSAVVISAILFALMHSNIEQLFYTFVAGLLFGWVYVRTKKLIYPIILHFLNNGISAIGDIIYERCAPEVYNKYSSYSDLAIYVVTFISLVVFLVMILKKGSFIEKTVMKPDENGEEVLPLSFSEKAEGFFSVGMIMFVMYSFITMAYYVYKSILV